MGPVSSVGRALDMDTKGPGFESSSGRRRVCPWARHFIHIAHKLSSEMLGLCGAEVKSRLSRIYKNKCYAPERVNAKEEKLREIRVTLYQ